VTGDENAGHGFGIVKEERHKVLVDGEPAGALVNIPGPSVKCESGNEAAIANMIRQLADTDDSGSESDPEAPPPPIREPCIVHACDDETIEQTMEAVRINNEQAYAEGTARRPTAFDPVMGPVNIPRSRAVGGYHVVNRSREYEVNRVFYCFPNHRMGPMYMVSWVGWPNAVHYTIEPCAALAGCCSCEPSRL
jgi:hypothetical protein